MSPRRLELFRAACARLGIEPMKASEHPLYRARESACDETPEPEKKTGAPRKHDPAPVLKLYSKGMGRAMIAKQLGVKPSAVHYILSRYGKKIKAEREARPKKRERARKWEATNGARACKYDPAPFVERRAAGMSMARIAAEFGIHRSAVRSVLKRYDSICLKLQTTETK